MTHTYQLTGMTCKNCEAKVKSALLTLKNVTTVEVSKAKNAVTITMDKHIALSDLQKALGGAESKYQIAAIHHNETIEHTKSWFETYKPILLIFGYIILVTGSIAYISLSGNHSPLDLIAMQWMRHFMAGFFLVFSFFKFLNLKGFAESYAMYDIVAKKIPAWAYLYPFIELSLGICFLIDFQPFITNLSTFIVMTISSIGVLQSVFNKKKIQCACLGIVFNLPISTVTVIEDLVMIVMSGIMLLIV